MRIDPNSVSLLGKGLVTAATKMKTLPASAAFTVASQDVVISEAAKQAANNAKYIDLHGKAPATGDLHAPDVKSIRPEHLQDFSDLMKSISPEVLRSRPFVGSNGSQRTTSHSDYVGWLEEALKAAKQQQA